MYRLVTLCLFALALISFAFSIGGRSYTPSSCWRFSQP